MMSKKGIEGFHVWWDFTTGGKKTRREIEQIAAKYNLKQYLPRAPGSGNLMRRAMTAADRALRDKNFHWSLVAHDDSYIVYRIWRVERTGNDAEMKKEVLLQYSKEHEFFLLDQADDPEAAEEINGIIMPLFLSMASKVTTSDISIVVSRALEDIHRVALKSSGHIYFVNKRYEEKLDAIEAFMVECGHRFFVAVAFTREEYVTEGVERTIQTVLQRIAEKSGKMKQQRSFDTALKELDDLEEMTELYGAVLAGAKRLMEKNIEEAREAVKDRLLEVTREKEEAKEEAGDA